MKFIDETKIFIQSGKGGDGQASFRREKYEPKGGPDGGDGGKGGAIILKSNPHLNTLVDFRNQKYFKAKSGSNGMSSNKTGRSGQDLYIEVPVGTQIFDEHSNLKLFDFDKIDATFKILTGGAGGLGNTHFKSSINQTPRKSTKGEPGEEMWITLSLKLLSDAGLVGLPNAGKSTFLSKVSRATPKIANYPFTTLTPKLGVVYINDSEFVLADIPGLIEGAHEGKGLGDKFLKHIERCKVLIHLLDASHDSYAENYLSIRNEIESYSNELINKKEIICLNKSDLLDRKDVLEKKHYLEKITKKEVLVISSISSDGIENLLQKTFNILNDHENPIS